ncbi:DUF7882 family protein [Leifsonia aquatica]|uniref:DUF7882 family protein n=1 Tax=Leifsonia aquatica TaxID=144185 RepID=UPI0037F60204
MYDGTSRVEFEDRAPAHLQVVIVNKLRRREAFTMSWKEDASTGGGRNCIWLDASLPLRFHFDGSKAPEVDRDWVERLMESAASNTGLIAIDEEGEPLVGRLVV